VEILSQRILGYNLICVFFVERELVGGGEGVGVS
jgi:hypothetical protein